MRTCWLSPKAVGKPVGWPLRSWPPMNSEPLSVCQTRSRSEMLLNAGGEDGAGGCGTALRESPEQQAAAHFAGGVLDGRQIEGLGLRPVAGDIVEVLGVGGDLLKDAPSGFDVGEVLFALILALSFFEQTVLAPDAFQGAMAERKIGLADKAARSEGEQLLTQSDDLLLDVGRSLAGLVMR